MQHYYYFNQFRKLCGRCQKKHRAWGVEYRARRARRIRGQKSEVGGQQVD